MYQDIEYRLDKHVAIITLNRPDRLNAWTGQMEKDIRAAMDAAAADSNVRAIVVTGAGRGFCAGADMNILTGIQAAPAASNDDTAGSDGGADNFNQKFSYMLAIPKPIFMAINGPIASPKYRLPLEPVFATLAAAGLGALRGISRRRKETNA